MNHLQLINSILLAQNPSATTVIIVIILVLAAICYILYRVFGHKGEFDPATLTNTSQGEGGDGTKGNGDIPAEQGNTPKDEGGGDSNGNGSNGGRTTVEVHLVEMPGLSDYAKLREILGPFAFFADGILELKLKMLQYLTIGEAADSFIEDFEEGAYDNRRPEIRDWIAKLVSTIKNWNWDESEDSSDLLWRYRIHVALLDCLNRIDNLNDMDPELWLVWLTMISDEQRILSDFEKIRKMADNYLEKDMMNSYYYIMSTARKATCNTKIEVPAEIQNQFLVPKEKELAFFAFEMVSSEDIHWEDVQRQDRIVQLNSIAEEMASEDEKGTYNGKSEPVILLIKQLLEQRSMERVYRDKQQYYDVLTLLESLRTIETEDEIDPEKWINYLRWCKDEDYVLDRLAKIRDIADDYLRREMLKPYLYIIFYAKNQFSKFKCKIPDEIRGTFEPEPKFKKALKDYGLRFTVQRLSWPDITRTPNEIINMEGSPQ